MTLENFRRSGTKVRYEELGIPYTIQAVYNPDWILPNGVIVETKGNFDAKDRSKHLLVQQQYPWLDIRFVFQRDNKLYKKSDTHYSEWCKRNGFKWAVGRVPTSWAKEKKKSPEYMAAIGQTDSGAKSKKKKLEFPRQQFVIYKRGGHGPTAHYRVLPLRSHQRGNGSQPRLRNHRSPLR